MTRRTMPQGAVGVAGNALAARRREGVSAATIRKVTVDTPRRAFEVEV